jgi:hypothetical protein
MGGPNPQVTFFFPAAFAKICYTLKVMRFCPFWVKGNSLIQKIISLADRPSGDVFHIVRASVIFPLSPPTKGVLYEQKIPS